MRWCIVVLLLVACGPMDDGIHMQHVGATLMLNPLAAPDAPTVEGGPEEPLPPTYRCEVVLQTDEGWAFAWSQRTDETYANCRALWPGRRAVVDYFRLEGADRPSVTAVWWQPRYVAQSSSGRVRTSSP